MESLSGYPLSLALGVICIISGFFLIEFIKKIKDIRNVTATSILGTVASLVIIGTIMISILQFIILGQTKDLWLPLVILIFLLGISILIGYIYEKRKTPKTTI